MLFTQVKPHSNWFATPSNYFNFAVNLICFCCDMPGPSRPYVILALLRYDIMERTHYEQDGLHRVCRVPRKAIPILT